MTTLLVLLILIGLTLYGLKEYYQVKLGIVPQDTPVVSILALADLLERSAPSGRLLDLGSGYGKRVLGLAQRLPNWEINGVEQSPTPWIMATMRTIGKNFGNYSFFLGNPMTWELADYDVVFLHQNERTIKHWEPSIARRLQPGTLLITYNKPLPHIKPIDTMSVNSQTTFYLYKRANPAVQAAPAPVLPLADNDMGTQRGFVPDNETPEQASQTLPL